VVADPEAAAARLLGQERPLASVWLVRAGAALPESHADRSQVEASPDEAGADRIVVEPFGVRLSRLPERARLGRKARQQQAAHLRRLAEGAERDGLEARAAVTAIETALRDLTLLQARLDLWLAGDPAAEIERCAGKIEDHRDAERQHRSRADALRLEIAEQTARRDAVRRALAEGHLFDEPDQAAVAAELGRQLAAARAAAGELSRVAQARAALLAHGHVLSAPAASEAERLSWPSEKIALEAERDRWFAVQEALRAIADEAAALSWDQAEVALRQEQRCEPELEAQHGAASAELAAAELSLERCEAEWETVTLACQRADAELAAVQAHLARARGELSAGAEDCSDEARAAVVERREQLQGRARELLAEERGQDTELALGAQRLGEASRRLEAGQAGLEQARREANAAHAAFRDLCAESERAGIPLRADGELVQAADAPAVVALWAAARSKLELLLDRVDAGRDGAALAETIRGRAGGEDEPSGSTLLAAWSDVRDWLLRRLPAPVAELGDPLAGLGRLRDDLGLLERHLARQEGELKGTSGDVSRSIDVQVRRAAAQVRRLNQHLATAAFGSIVGMRIEMRRVEKMQQVLSALRDGQTGDLLFQSSLPFEEALDEIFRRYGGGRGGGARLVDFREYLELHVEIQRRTEEQWQRVNPSQVSTGEAIGIGTALLMVILTEWEREALLFRSTLRGGALRFLFLDEANRLSQDNLGVLFHLCASLDLQLLIAAPEVARAEGNTTYRLVRRVNELGEEEVLVSGRRASPPDVAERSVEPTGSGESVRAEQIHLFG
jgi:chromosome partition protein MukB